MLRLILFAICLAILSVHGKNTEEQRTVHLEGLGNVIGEKFWDGEFYEFYGIPYASMPKGRDRYKVSFLCRKINLDSIIFLSIYH